MPHPEPRIQRVKDSKPPGFKDSRTQAFKDSRIQAFKDSGAHGWKDSMIHVWAFVPRQPHQTFPNSSCGSPQGKAYEDTCSKALGANVNLDKSKNYLQHKTTKEKTKKILEIVNTLEDLDDVQKIFTNVNL